MQTNKEKTNEALLVIITGFLLLFIIYQNALFLYISFSIGLTAVFIRPLAKLVAAGWFKLGELLGFVVSKIVLTVMFYLLLMPVALLHNIFNKDVLKLKKGRKTLWVDRNHRYITDDLKNIW